MHPKKKFKNCQIEEETMKQGEFVTDPNFEKMQMQQVEIDRVGSHKLQSNSCCKVFLIKNL